MQTGDPWVARHNDSGHSSIYFFLPYADASAECCLQRHPYVPGPGSHPLAVRGVAGSCSVGRPVLDADDDFAGCVARRLRTEGLGAGVVEDVACAEPFPRCECGHSARYERVLGKASPEGAYARWNLPQSAPGTTVRPSQPWALRRRKVCALAGRKRRRPAAISQGEDRAAAARHRREQVWQKIRMSRPVANQT